YNPSHSELKVKEAEIELIKANKESVKSKLLPEFTLAYNNASFKGNAPNDLYYDTSHRFSSYQVGVAVPIFQNGIRNSMKTLDMDVKLKEEELEITKLQFENTVLNLQESIQKQREIVNYYQQKMLPSNQVLNHIHAIFYEGDISYIEFVTLVNQNMESQSNFLDVQSNLYQSIVLLNYYTL
ncbi:MAG: TolC family protein, partial [Flavobacterium sp.]|nr:TolC family protein [Candidatus Neoflavobacterium equi]